MRKEVVSIIEGIRSKYIDRENNKLIGEWKKVHARVYTRVDFMTKKPLLPRDKNYPEAVDMLYESQNRLLIAIYDYNRRSDKIKYSSLRRFTTSDFSGLLDGLELGMTPEQTDKVLGKPEWTKQDDRLGQPPSVGTGIRGDWRSYGSDGAVIIYFKNGKSYLLDFYETSSEGQDWTEKGESIEVNERLAEKIIASW